MAGRAGSGPEATTRRVEGGAEYVNKNLLSEFANGVSVAGQDELGRICITGNARLLKMLVGAPVCPAFRPRMRPRGTSQQTATHHVVGSSLESIAALVAITSGSDRSSYKSISFSLCRAVSGCGYGVKRSSSKDQGAVKGAIEATQGKRRFVAFPRDVSEHNRDTTVCDGRSVMHVLVY